MEVIVPQAIVASTSTLANQTYKSILLESNIGLDPDISTQWSSTAEYSTGDYVDFLSTTGPTSGCWCRYQALKDMTTALGNLNKIPEEEAEYWSSSGAINRYKMFDQYVGTTTLSSTADITVTLHCKAITSVAFLNVQARTITINAWRGTEIAHKTEERKIIDNQIINLTQPINNWYEYWFKDFEYTRDVGAPLDITLYHNIILEITFEKYTGIDCYVGAIIPGRTYDIGALQYGVKTGIADYSKKVFDETFGSHYVQQGNYRKTLSGTLRITKDTINSINSVITQLRGIPTVWQGNQYDTEYDNLLLFGIVAEWVIVMDYPTYYEVSIEIEGFI